MATQVKLITRDGQFGLMLHKHGNSAWHPVNEKHTRFVGRADRDNDEQSHELHVAEKPVFLGEGWTKDRKAEYLEVLRTNKPQEYWHIAWLKKLADRKAKKSGKDAVAEAVALIATPAGVSDPAVLV